MLLLPLLFWVVLAPYAVAAIVYRAPAFRRLIVTRFWHTVALGCAGAAMLALGALLYDTAAGVALLAAGAPVLGLTFWIRSGGDGPDQAPPPPTPSDWGPVDWERFARDVDRWARTTRPPPVPTPSAGPRQAATLTRG